MATKARQQYHADEVTLSKERREFSISDDVQEKIDGIEEGAQVNTIETIRVNGNEVQPDENKAIDLAIPGVIDSLSSTSITDALSARQGKILYDKIDNVSRIGHFLALWDASTGLPVTDPEVSPYEYHAGDFYTISVVASQGGTNYKPSGTEYVSGQASTAVETDDVEVNDFYFYDGTYRRHMKNSGAGGMAVDGSLSTTSTNPVENRVITNALSGKQNTLTAGANIQINGNTISATDTKYTAGTGISIANGVISNTQTSAEWGNITGTLSDQTDLQTVLTSKATDANVVHKTGAETIAGTKTFSTSPVVPSKTTAATNTGTAIATEAQVYKKQDTLVSGTNIKTVNSNSLLGSGNLTLNDVKVSATAPSNPTEGMVWYDTTNDSLKAYNGTSWETEGTKMVVLEYGVSTWQDFLDAYNKNAVVYCKVSSGSSGYRMAFMAYTAGKSTPTEVEFQYYRSRSSHSTAANQLDEVYVYKLTNAGVWTTTQRDTAAKAIAGTGIGLTFNSSGMTISADTTTLATKTYVDEHDTVVSSTAPSSPTEGMVWYDTTNDQLKVYDGTNWNVVGDESADINTKTFLLASDSDKATATEAYKRFSEGNYPIIMRGSATFVGPRLSGNNLVFTQTEPYYNTGNTTTSIQPRTITFMYDTSTEQVTQILYSIGGGIPILQTNQNYSTPYTPLYDGSPATKKYVDDSVVEYNAGEGIEIGTIQDYSAMRGPCPEGFHVPSQNEWVALCGILTTTFGLSNNMTTLNTYLKMPSHGYRSEANGSIAGSTSLYYWSSTRNADYAAGSVYATSSAINLGRFNARARGFNVRGFRDKPIIPDGSWVTLYDGSSVSVGAGIFHNLTLGLISVSGDGINWTTIADKNLGASTVYNNGDTVTDSNCGGYFQWGNNYMFPFSGSVTTSSTKVDATGYGPGNYYSSDIFITPSDSPKRRENPENTNLRGGVTGVVTIENAITNTGVLSVNGQTGDVVIASPEESNTKTFYLSSTSDLTNAQAAYDWYAAGKNPIIVYGTEKPIYTVYDTSGGLRFRSSDSKKSTGTSSSMINYGKMLSLVVSSGNVTSISVGDYTGNAISVLATGQNYSTPYTPQYDGSPATKKYVDDSVIEYNAGEGIEIGTVQDYSAMRGPCPEGFHIPTNAEGQNLCSIVKSLGITREKTNTQSYLKLPYNGQVSTNGYVDTVNQSGVWTATGYNLNSSYRIIVGTPYSTGTTPSSPGDAKPIRPFKDVAVIPDNTWVILYDGSSIAAGAGIFHNVTLGLISLSTDGVSRVTIMDKNLGATVVYNDGDSYNKNNVGRCYQWGNIHGFEYGTQTNTSTETVDVSGYQPGNYYSSDVFIKSTTWASTYNANLRGGQTGVVTLNNAITNTGVLSVNGQTGDVTLKTINNNVLVGSGNISLNVIFSGAITPAASSQYEGKIFYNTADKVFYTCDGTQWSAIGSGGFELAPNSPLSPKYRRYGTQAQYEALTQYYTDEAGDTVYFTI